MQSKKGSLVEAIVNTFIGFLITLIVSPIIYYIVGTKMSAYQLGLANILFTIVSVIRNYVIRRCFENGKIYTHR